MKHLLLTTIAAVVLVGCGPPKDIQEAARQGNIEAVKEYLAAGTDVNVVNNWRETPLHHAALGGQKEIAELLIAKGADVNAKGVGDTTPLDTDIFARKTETADLLRKHGGKRGAELKAEGK